jgi:hypothetical protein
MDALILCEGVAFGGLQDDIRIRTAKTLFVSLTERLPDATMQAA